jgi:MFS family permease
MPQGARQRWVVAAAMGLLGFVVWGVGFYAMPVFYVPLEAEFHWSRTALTFMGALTIFSYSVSGPVVGALADHIGVRKILAAGVALFGASLALFAAGPSSLGLLYVVGCANGVACAFVSLLPSQILISKWFEKNRAGVMGFVLTLMALGGIVGAALAGNLIGRLGWRQTALLFDAAVWLVALPVSLLVIRERPAGVGAGRERGEGGAAVSDDPALGEALRGPQFYLLCAAVFFNMAVGNALLQNIVLYVNDLGHGLSYGAYVMSGVVVANLVARLAIGVVSDRTSLKFGMLLSYACLGLSVLVFLSAATKPVLIFAGLLTGFGYGGSILSLPVMAAAIFGTRSLGKILGMVLLSLGVGSASGTFLVGRLFDATKSYDVAFLPLVLCAAASVAAVGLLSPRPMSRTARRPGLFKFAFGKRD